MKNVLKRVSALLLATVMLLGLAACGAGSGTGGGTSQGNSTQTVSGGTDTAAAGSTDEPVTITWGVGASQVQQFFDGDTYDNNRWSRLIKEKLNVDIQVAFSADSQTNAFRDKLNALLAAGDLPDVWCWNDRTFMQQAYDAGYLMDLTDIFNEYASDSVKSYMERYPECFEGASIDGRLYAFPYISDNFHQAPFLWIREDWLKNLNAEAPKTIEEMIALAKRFTFEDPDGNGIDDTFGLALDKNIMLNNYGTASGILAAFGEPSYQAGMGYYYRGADGKVTSPYISEGMKSTLGVLNELYTAGVIDPEFINMDGASMQPKILNGNYGMMYHMNWGTWDPFQHVLEQDGVITKCFPIPTVNGIDYKCGVLSSKTDWKFMVNANCKNPEKIIEILNLYNEMCIEFTDEETYKYYWDNEQYRLCPIYIGIPTELYTDIVSEAMAKGSGDSLVGTAKVNYDQVTGFDAVRSADMENWNSGYGAWGQMRAMEADGSGGSCTIALDIYKKNNALVANLMDVNIPEIYMQNASVWEAMMVTSFTDIIRGEKPLDYFDTFVSDWKKAGGQQCLDELETMYPAN